MTKGGAEMKSVLICLNAVLRGMCCLAAAASLSTWAASPSNAGANARVRAFYDYLVALPQATQGKLLSGQHTGYTTSYTASNATVAYGYDHFVTALATRTGRTVAIVGADYGPVDTNVSYPIDYAPVNAPLLRHASQGGVLTVMFSARNPWTGKLANDLTFGLPLSELLQEGTAANLAWMRQLDSVAAGLQVLKDAGATVLFRPLHEMNGAWFWWGYNRNSPSYAQDVAALWRHMHGYFSQTKGLDNLLWVYNVTPQVSTAIPSETALYPGDAYVDVVSFDVYTQSFDTATVNAYARLKALGKPVALAEFGPTNRAWDGSYDYQRLLTEIRSKTPDLAYFMAWSDYGSPQLGYALISLASNLNADKLLADPLVVTVENLPTTFNLSDEDCFFTWAEARFASFLPDKVSTQSNSIYRYRYYPGTDFYLGHSSADGLVYYTSPRNSVPLTSPGSRVAYYSQARATACR